jgi:RNA polymerase sigma-70 factor (ECF subfamily)
VERYLRAAVRDAESASELAQEFALKVLRGQLGGVAPERGRFREYVKGVLRHLIVDYYRRPRREVQLREDMPEPASPGDDVAELDREWARGWRQELLNRAWTALDDHEARTGQPVSIVLRFRAEHAELRSHDMAEQLGARLGRELTPDWVRQTLHRARERFGELLLGEIADTLSDPGVGDLEEELVELELLQYCQGALEQWRSKRDAGR